MEVELGFNKRFGNLTLWSRLIVAHNENKVIFRDDGETLAPYLKKEGYAINQHTSLLNSGYIMQNWNDVYAAAPSQNDNGNQLPGYYELIDFNGDGLVRGVDDAAPIGYSTVPRNTGSLSVGANYKGFNFMMQFYGVNNVNRRVDVPNWSTNLTDVLFTNWANYWSKDNPNAEYPLPRLNAVGPGHGQLTLYDGSYLRLQAVELGYTFNSGWITKIGIDRLKIYLSGNDLFLWSHLPDDRDVGSISQSNAYPRMKRYNLGIELSF